MRWANRQPHRATSAAAERPLASRFLTLLRKREEPAAGIHAKEASTGGE
ncbi:hypothetical protein ACU4GD_41495 [Cupriavidus basilensis]